MQPVLTVNREHTVKALNLFPSKLPTFPLAVALVASAPSNAIAIGARIVPNCSDTAVGPSDDPVTTLETTADQQEVYQLIRRYEAGLNAGDTNTIVNLFADDSVAEWNNRRTYATRQQKIDGHNELFEIAKFSTVRAFDAINVYGDTAVVRTRHRVGQTVIENGKKMLDFNREVFVLRKVDGVWKVVLYIYNSDPAQGEG
jgi:ketosteroid isomerase-like protein